MTVVRRLRVVRHGLAAVPEKVLAVLLLATMSAADVHAEPGAPGVAPPDPGRPIAMSPPAIPDPDFSGPIHRAYDTHGGKPGETGRTYLTFVFTHGRLTNIVAVPSEPTLGKADGSGHP